MSDDETPEPTPKPPETPEPQQPVPPPSSDPGDLHTVEHIRSRDPGDLHTTRAAKGDLDPDGLE